MKRLSIVVAGAALAWSTGAGAADHSHDTVVCSSFRGPGWTDNTWRRWGSPAHEPVSGTLYRLVRDRGYGFRKTAYPVNCGLAVRWAEKDVLERPRRLLGGRGPVGHTRFTVSGRHAPVGDCETGPVHRGGFHWWPADYDDDVQFSAQFGFWPYPGRGR